MRTVRLAWKGYLLLTVIPMLGSSSVAATLYVGTCHSPSYSTISAAVAAAPPGSAIAVCPGTYQEQVFITQPLTLQGIRSGNADRARIIVPASITGGSPNWQFVPDPDFINKIAPQIYVNSPTGPVNISNLTIDGSGEMGSPSSCPPTSSSEWETVAILYENTSGSIKQVNTVGQGKNSSCGVGIRAYAAPPVIPTVTISNNSLQDATLYGMYLEAPMPGASMTVSVTNNTMTVGSQNYGSAALYYDAVSGVISSNFISTPGHGVWDYGSSGVLTVSNNTILSTNGAAGFGGVLGAGGLGGGTEAYTANKVVNYYVGLDIPPGPSTTKNNLVVNSYLGIEVGCNTVATISGNVVNNAQIGMDTVPTGFSATGKISFFSADQVQGSSTCP